MYAQISTWTYRPEDNDQLERDLAPVFATLRRQPGYVAGYAVDAAADTGVIVTVWASEPAIDTAFAALTDLHQVVAGRMELVDRKRGPARNLGPASPA